MKKRKLVFVDDSGDPGFRATSSANFVMAAVVTDSSTANEIDWKMAEFKLLKKWGPRVEFKFQKTNKDIIRDLLKLLQGYNFKVYAIYIDKANFRDNYPQIKQSEIYNWVIKELLKLIPLDGASVKIDGRSTRQHMLRTATYLRRELVLGGKGTKIKFEDSVNNNLIQLTDLVAGAINRSMQRDKTDAGRYIKIIDDKIVELRKVG